MGLAHDWTGLSPPVGGARDGVGGLSRVARIAPLGIIRASWLWQPQWLWALSGRRQGQASDSPLW